MFQQVSIGRLLKAGGRTNIGSRRCVLMRVFGALSLFVVVMIAAEAKYNAIDVWPRLLIYKASKTTPLTEEKHLTHFVVRSER